MPRSPGLSDHGWGNQGEEHSARTMPKGPSINDVTQIFGVLEPPPPLCHVFTQPINSVCLERDVIYGWSLIACARALIMHTSGLLASCTVSSITHTALPALSSSPLQLSPAAPCPRGVLPPFNADAVAYVSSSRAKYLQFLDLITHAA